VKHGFITFLSDFGLTDDFVGTCHGVIKRIAPDVEIIDVTHGITRQGVLPGALVLRNTLPYMPTGVHLAVVDPGVGSARRPVIIRDAEGDFFVGPDNGLLVPAAELRGIESAHELAKEILSERRDSRVTSSEILVNRETIEKDEFEALLAGKTEEEVFGPEEPPSAPPLPVEEPAAERPGATAPRPLPRPGLAGGSVETRGGDGPEGPSVV